MQIFWVNPIPHELLERRCYMTPGQYDPELIFGFTSQQMAMLASKLVLDIILDIWDPSTSIFQHLKESVPPFMSFKLDQFLRIETLKIGKAPKGPPFETEKNFCLQFHSNFVCETLRS